jgi:hypothetical protein
MEATSARIIILEAKEQGQWSESLEAMLWSKQSEKFSSQSTVQSTLYNLTKVDAAC